MGFSCYPTQKRCPIYRACILLLEFSLNLLVCPAFQANASLSDSHWCLFVCLHAPMCVVSFCICVHMCGLMCVCRSKWQAYGGLRLISSISFSSLFTEARFLHKCNMSRSLTEPNIVSLAGRLDLGISCFYFLWSYMGERGLPAYLMFMCVVEIQNLMLSHTQQAL